MTRRLTSVTASPARLGDAGAGPPLVVLIGPPGSGKGTQCERLGEQFGLAHVSAGDALRDAVRRGSRLGEQARGFVDAGRLVPDELVIEVVTEHMGGVGDASSVVLDGFPRTVAQAETLDRLRPGGVRLAIVLVVPTLTVLRRLAWRGRTDDRPEVLRARLASYERDTRPLLSWFAARGMLQRADGNQRHAAVTAALLDLVEGVGIVTAPALECC